MTAVDAGTALVFSLPLVVIAAVAGNVWWAVEAARARRVGMAVAPAVATFGWLALPVVVFAVGACGDDPWELPAGLALYAATMAGVYATGAVYDAGRRRAGRGVSFLAAAGFALAVVATVSWAGRLLAPVFAHPYCD